MRNHIRKYFAGKLGAVLLGIVCVLGLSGCEAAENFILKQAGVLSDEEYQTYLELKNSGQLDEEGYYKSPELEEYDPEGKVHVTFAKNAYIEVEYYLDPALTLPVEVPCYLNPGECIYARVADPEHPFSSYYRFDTFCVYEYDEENHKGKELLWVKERKESYTVLQIPEDYKGREVSVEPLGRYEKRTLELEDYYIDADGQRQDTFGVWLVNGERIYDGKTEVSPVEALEVEFQYDAEKYEYVSSGPESFYHEDGVVQFETVYANDELDSFSVELQQLESERNKPFLSVVMKDSVKDVDIGISASDIQRDNLNYEDGWKDTWLPEWMANLVGQSDRIIFEDKVGTRKGITFRITDSGLRAEEALKLEITIRDSEGNQRNSVRYITKAATEEKIDLFEGNGRMNPAAIYEEVMVIVSRVEKETYLPQAVENADILVELADVTESYVLKEGDILDGARSIKITIAPKRGYYIGDSGTNIYSDTMKYSEWKKDCSKILEKHPVKKILYVTLDTADAHGECVYKLDGNEVSGKVELREGQKLVLEYTLTDSDYRIVRKVNPGGIVGNIFHKNTESVDISVSEELDGKTVRCSDYITVEEKGEK